MTFNEKGEHVCEECGETHDLVVIAKCHPYAVPKLIFSSHTQVIKLECSVCDKSVAYFIVAGGPYQEMPQ